MKTSKLKSMIKEANIDMEKLFSDIKPENEATRRLGKHSIKFKGDIIVLGAMSIASEKEAKGTLGSYFDKIMCDAKYNQKTFELAEQAMLKDAIDGALKNAGLDENSFDALLSGDLLNQIISAGYAARSFASSFIGLYGACSSMGQSLLLGSCLIDGGFIDSAACATSSHFASAERQYRGPLEHGAQKQPYSQWTVTGAGATVIGRGTPKDKGVRITHGTFGRVIDFGLTDMANMGAAMAPAAAQTLKTFFVESGFVPKDFDMIATGDLGKLGSDILRKLMLEQGYDLGSEYSDCGAMIYKGEQRAFQGGSGCGCSAIVLNGYILKKLKSREFRRVLFAPTGALMSPLANQQGETMPSVCHAVVFES